MPPTPIAERVLLLDIDGLRRDVFEKALHAGHIPTLSRLLGGPNVTQGQTFAALSTAPSITYCCQASMFTGAHPNEHLIAGNQFFDRFGRLNNGVPRHYGFDVGPQLALADGIGVFKDGLAGQVIHPQVETIYETAARYGRTSTVVYNMYARGATNWIKPGPEDWLRFFSLRESFGISSERYDRAMYNDALEHLRQGHRPDILTLYLWGLDHKSHDKGPASQYEYLTQIADPQLGQFIEEYEAMGLLPGTLIIVHSDHGQVPTHKSDTHALQIGFPFDRELGYFFDALGLDVHDIPGEVPNVDALLTLNGGLAHVYLQNAVAHWRDPPRFKQDVLRVAEAFYRANRTGKYSKDLHHALDLVLVRNVEREGWYADYQVFTLSGLVPVDDYLSRHPYISAVDASHRLRALSSPVTGDILLHSNYRDGYYFMGVYYAGIHGGMAAGDSEAVLAFALPGASAEQAESLRTIASDAIQARCAAEGGRQVSVADAIVALRAAMGWQTLREQAGLLPVRWEPS